MNSTRQNKFARLIQKEIGELFQRNGFAFYSGALVSITMVRISPDLSVAKIYLSIFGTKDRNELLEQIQYQTKEIRKQLGIKIKNQVRHIPELDFFLDDSFDYAEKMDHLLKTIGPVPESGDKD